MCVCVYVHVHMHAYLRMYVDIQFPSQSRQENPFSVNVCGMGERTALWTATIQHNIIRIINNHIVRLCAFSTVHCIHCSTFT